MALALACGCAAESREGETQVESDEARPADASMRDAAASPRAPARDARTPAPADAARSRPTGASDGAVEREPGPNVGDAGEPPAPTRDDDAAAPAQGDAAVASACPQTTTLRTGDNRLTLEHGGRTRSYIVYVPSGLMAGRASPLVLDFHGNGGSGMQEEGSSGWREKANAELFLVAYPDGVGNAWNVGNCCGEALAGKVDDVGFARAIIREVRSKACVDEKRVYATGLSNGAGLAHRIACEAADVVAAIAAASADLVTEPCKPARPISELSVRGTRDTLVAYEGGNTGSTGWYSPGAKGTLELWKGINECSGGPETKHQYCETYASCRGGVEVSLCSLPGAGHILYRNSLGFSVPDVAWQMFTRQRLP